MPPLDTQTITFVKALRDAVAGGRAVVVHCRAGIGRSSLIAAAILRLLGVEADEALSRLAAARGLPVPDTEEVGVF